MNKKEITFSAIISLAVITLLTLGFLGGRYATLAPLRDCIREMERLYTLGPSLGEHDKPGVLSTFYPVGQDTKALDDYSWSPPCLVTPFVGGAPAPGRQGNAQINSLQFRSPREVRIPKTNGVFRIFLTGGSTAYSSGAPSDEQTIAGYLEKNLSLNHPSNWAFEVFTMATPAWASTHERIAIENLLSELQPDLVVALSGNNDVHWGERGANILWFKTYHDENIFNFIKYIYAKSRGFHLKDNLRPNSEQIAPQTVAARLRKNVEISSFALAQTRTPFLFVLQPTLAAVTKHLTVREKAILQKQITERPNHQQYFQSCYREIDQTLAAATGNYHYLNLSAVFSGRDMEEIFIDSYHFGDRGNEIIAGAIAAKIETIVPL